MSTNPQLNKSLIMDGVSNDLIFPVVNGSFSFMGWLKPDFASFNSPLNILSFIPDNNQTLKLNPDSTLSINNTFSTEKLIDGWNHISVSHNNQNNITSIYINGQKSFDSPANAQPSASSSIQVCDNFIGNIDEFSIWKKALGETYISDYFDKFIQRKNEDIIAYFHCDEGMSDYIYDCSIDVNDIFNHNHIKLGNLINNFSLDAPSSDAVKYCGTSDANGYYIIKEVRYSSVGKL